MKQRQDTERPEQRKKRYSQLAAQRILLRAEEAVLAVCKTNASLGPEHNTCGTTAFCNVVAS